jgi:hypothetical protein
MSDPAWTEDAQGQRVMLGLTADETAEYQSLLNVSSGVSCEEMLARFACLQGRLGADVSAAGFVFTPDNGGGEEVRRKKTTL